MPALETDQSPEILRSPTWVAETTAKLQLLESAQAGEPVREERHWSLVSEVLADFAANSAHLTPHLAESAAKIYDDHQSRGEHMRGYFFEDLSRAIPLNHRLNITFVPAEMRAEEPEKIEAFRHRLDRLQQKTVFELKTERPESVDPSDRLVWNKSAMIGAEIKRRLEALIKEKNLEEQLKIYVPAFDGPTKVRDAWVGEGKVVIHWNDQEKKWVVKAKQPEVANAHQDWADQAKTINQELNDRWTLPDAVLFDGDKAVGIVETKCWQDEELAELNQLLLELPDSGPAGGYISLERIDWQRRQVQGSGSGEYAPGTVGLNLLLRLREELAFVEQSVGKRIDQPVILLRFPANLPPDEIEDLQDLLFTKGFNNILIQQVLLTANEVETIATEFIHSHEFVAALEQIYQNIPPGSTNIRLHNVHARMLALNQSPQLLDTYLPPNNPDWQDKAVAKLKADWEKHKKR